MSSRIACREIFIIRYSSQTTIGMRMSITIVFRVLTIGCQTTGQIDLFIGWLLTNDWNVDRVDLTKEREMREGNENRVYTGSINELR